MFNIIKNKKYLLIIPAILLIAGSYLLMRNFFFSNQDNPLTIIRHDTTLITRYKTEIKKDTIIKWYQKIVYKKANPDTIYFQKTDTAFIESTDKMDLMLQVKKERDKLFIKTVNKEGNILKEYVYKNIYDNFSLISLKDNIYVKTGKFEWLGIYGEFNAGFSFDNFKETDYKPGIGTGLIFMKRFEAGTSVYYSTLNKKIFVNANLKIKL
jgi:hypothetical protein